MKLLTPQHPRVVLSSVRDGAFRILPPSITGWVLQPSPSSREETRASRAAR